MHTGGEPLRIITGGLPLIEGADVLEKRRFFRDRLDHIRTGLMWEPRGHADMYGAVLSRSSTADFDVFFLHNEGYSTMCGHAIIALTKFVAEAGLVDRAEVTFNVPAGRIEARAHWEGEVVRTTSFKNVPSFVYRSDQCVDVPGYGPVDYDITFGGAFYAIVDAKTLGLSLEKADIGRLIEAGRAIKRAVAESIPIDHPHGPDLSFLYGTIL
nr:proline racemase family protein [Sphingomonas sp. Y57]